MDKQKLGKYIVSLRKKQNMTQKDLADKLHVTVPAISKWERGLNFPDIILLEPLANCFNISVAELLSQSPSGQSSPEVKEYIQNLIIIAMNNVQRRQKVQKKLSRLVIASTLIILLLIGILIYMVHFVHKPTFQIVKTEYTVSSSTAGLSQEQKLLEIYVYTQDNVSQPEIKEHTDSIYEQWQTGIFTDREIDAIHILYFDSLFKLKTDGYFYEAYILTQ